MSLILDLKTVEKVSSNISSQNESIVFTHGAFDLLHVGHIELLKKSKAQGDYLFVGVEDDERIYKYKNIKRPIVPIEQRIRMLLNLRFVDAVFCLSGAEVSDNYYANVYSRVRPNVITFGRNFPFSKKIEARVSQLIIMQALEKSTRVKKISHRFDNIVSTTKILDKILKV